MEGDATALYLKQQMDKYAIANDTIGTRFTDGGDLGYADQNTLLRALAGRQEMD